LNNNKSKFVTFLLSFVPGTGHMYLGFMSRGLIFFTAFFADIFMLILFDEVFSFNKADVIAIFLPIIWLLSLVDSMSLLNKMRMKGFESKDDSNNLYDNYDSDEVKKQNRKIIAMLLSVVPGAGHMYLKLFNQGLELMTTFFLCIYLSDWLKISILLIMLPIIWFYSIFDVMYKADSEEKLSDEDIAMFSWINKEKLMPKDKSKIWGYAFIVIGIIALFERIVFPEIEKMIDYHIREYVQTVIVSALFIIVGIKLIKSSNSSKSNMDGDDLKQ